MSKTVVYGQLVLLKRLNNSVNGNPRFEACIYTPAETLIFKTQSDNGLNYEITNHMNEWGAVVLNGRNIIIHINFKAPITNDLGSLLP